MYETGLPTRGTLRTGAVVGGDGLSRVATGTSAALPGFWRASGGIYTLAGQTAGMDVPNLVAQRLDGRPRSMVALDGDDVAVFAPDRTLLYRGDSLLRDADVEVYGHDIERLTLSAGRRKTTFVLEYVGADKQFTVPERHAEAVLEQFLGGVLETAGVTDDGERVQGVYLFSDLTVVVTDARLVKHVGTAVWDSEYDEVPFAAVSGLDFEEGSVATQVVLWVEGRAERIKAPSDEAPLLRRTLTRALCAFHDVDSLDELAEFGPAAEDPAPDSSIVLDDNISPLIESSDESGSGDSVDTAAAVARDDWLEPTTADATGPRDSDPTGDPDRARPVDDPTGGGPAADRAGGDRSPGETTGRDQSQTDVDALEQRVRELTRAVDRQSELLEQQTQRLSELAERLDTDR